MEFELHADVGPLRFSVDGTWLFWDSPVFRFVRLIMLPSASTHTDAVTVQILQLSVCPHLLVSCGFGGYYVT